MAKGVTYIMVDVETTGPVPGLYAMIQLGAVVVEPGLKRTFYGEFQPERDHEIQDEALTVVGVTREQIKGYPPSSITIKDFHRWVKEVAGDSRPVFVSDNNGFDYSFVAYYFENWGLDNPFGWTSVNLGSLYKGVERSMFKNFKHLRRTPHTHNPVDDAMGNAEAMLTFGMFVAGLPHE